MSDYITPLSCLGGLSNMLIHLAIELDLPKLIFHNESWEGMVVSPPGDPNTVIFNSSSAMRKGNKWKVGQGCLNPDDLAKVEAVTALQSEEAAAR